MMSLFRFFLMLLVAVSVALPAMADELSDAKRVGSVGERPDGYLGLVSPNADASARALVTRINAARKEEYQRIAAKNGQAVDVVEKLAAKKVFEMAPAGTYFLDASGGWTQK